MDATLTAGNPVSALRERLGQTRAEFVRRFGLSYTTVAQAETGWTRELPRPLRAVFAQAGEDPDAAAEQYRRWRRSFETPQAEPLGEKGA